MQGRTLLVLLSVVIAISTSACLDSKQENSVTPGAKPPKQEQPKPQQQAENSLVKLKTAPNFRPVGWLGNSEVIGLKEEQLLTFNIETGKERKLPVKAWNASLAPDRQTVAYDDEQGIWVYERKTKQKRLVWPRTKLTGEGELAFLWGKTAKQLLISHVYEWDGEHFVLNLDTGKEVALHTELKNYFLTFPVGWLTEDTVLFETRASVSQAGTKDYSFGYRGDLVSVSVNDNQPRLITHSKDGEFYYCNSIDEGNITALLEREAEQPTLVRLDFQGQALETKTLKPQVRFIVNRGKREALLIEQDQQNSQLVSSFTITTASGKELGKLEAEAIIGIVENQATGKVLLALLEASQGEAGQQNGIWMIE